MSQLITSYSVGDRVELRDGREVLIKFIGEIKGF